VCYGASLAPIRRENLSPCVEEKILVILQKNILFWWQLVASLAWALLALVLCAMAVMFVCNISSVKLLMFLFGVFGGMCGENSCNVFPLLFMVLWVPISATLFRRAVLMLWHAFMFHGRRYFPLTFILFIGGIGCFFLL
jgi:hypothetical protein